MFGCSRLEFSKNAPYLSSIFFSKEVANVRREKRSFANFGFHARHCFRKVNADNVFTFFI